MSDSLQPHGLQHTRAPCPSPTPRVYSNSCPLSQWYHPTISSPVILFSSCLQTFPVSVSFLMSWRFTSGGQNICASALVFLVKVQDWFPLGLTFISLLSKALSRVFSNTTAQKHQSPYNCQGVGNTTISHFTDENTEVQRGEIRFRLHRWVAGDLGSQSRGLLQILPSEAGSIHLSELELPGGAMVPEEDAFTADHPWTPAETRGLIHWCLIQHDNQHPNLHTKVRLLFSPLTVWQVVCLSSIWIDWTHYKVGNISSPWIKSDKNGYPTKYETEKSIPFSTNPLLCFYRQVGNWNHNVCVCVCVLSRIRLFSDPMDCSLPDSSVNGIFWQEYYSGFHFLLWGSFWPRDWTCISCGLLNCKRILYPPSHQGMFSSRV